LYVDEVKCETTRCGSVELELELNLN